MPSAYENAPATQLLATSCACCARPLVDAESVESGVGPECRKKHGYGKVQGPADWAAVFTALGPFIAAAAAEWAGVQACADDTSDGARRAANVLVHRIAAEQDGARVLAMVTAVADLGFSTLAARIMKRLITVRILAEGTALVVSTPFNDDANTAFRGIRSRRWDKARKANVFAASDRVAVWSVLRAHFHGAHATGPKGAFIIE